ncbi:alpha/beta hydrolase fold domain-containing protein [Rhizobium rhizogenes]|uniref:alpha/beta hydrolase fold domain-containing protein n=1 Tax=Rhizobium rhizogenes TaxID=359 RepID=UPI00138E07C4|nr:alpha/beta hydrolase fold domain-containing protein [Rhizobium rhizogenes]MDJ1635239.1 alpha/beta hydrolase fold domain-containing protein [Rhizobium rhizogenes]NTG10668.1 alpha/beta hydrolase [Rhizobium rhizogenes]NTG76713.1 alpha/beta hydrolase [Rhizobium rhizogenes]
MLAQKLHADGAGQPRQLVLLSPFLDGSMSNSGYAPIENNDPSLSIEIGKMAGKLWAGDLDVKDPRVSPIYGSRHFAGLYRIQGSY